MIEVRYALIVRDDVGSRLAVVGTGREPKTLHGKIAPAFHGFCSSLLARYPVAVSIEMVPWRAGVDVELVPVMVVARRTEQTGQLAYRFPSSEEGQVQV